MDIGRIYFPGNPWPEGHKVKEFRWTTEIKGDDLWFHFHLETDKYHAERHIEDDESIEYPSDWKAPIVWGNYQSCIISSNSWHFGGFKVCALKEYSLDMLDGLLLHLDPLPCDLEDPDSSHQGYEFFRYHLARQNSPDVCRPLRANI
jgi:hypothetical protein